MQLPPSCGGVITHNHSELHSCGYMPLCLYSLQNPHYFVLLMHAYCHRRTIMFKVYIY